MPGDRSKPTLWRYWENIVLSRELIKRVKPSVLVLMLPPSFIIAVLRKFVKPRAVILDLHSGALNDPKWSWTLPLVKLVAGRSAYFIVTNTDMSRRLKVDDSRIFVLHDSLSPQADAGVQAETPLAIEHLAGKRIILCPLSYAADEPVRDILKAAELGRSDEVWVLTGKAPQWVAEANAPNVHLAGYVSEELYKRLVANASVMVALTSRSSTMQRAGYEALISRIPLVTSDHDVLREFHANSALYTSPESSAIAGAVKKALDNESSLRVNASAILQLRSQEQEVELSRLQSLVTSVAK